MITAPVKSQFRRSAPEKSTFSRVANRNLALCRLEKLNFTQFILVELKSDVPAFTPEKSEKRMSAAKNLARLSFASLNRHLLRNACEKSEPVISAERNIVLLKRAELSRDKLNFAKLKFENPHLTPSRIAHFR